MLHEAITKHLTRSVFGRMFILLKYTTDRNTDWIIAGLNEKFSASYLFPYGTILQPSVRFLKLLINFSEELYPYQIPLRIWKAHYKCRIFWQNQLFSKSVLQSPMIFQWNLVVSFCLEIFGCSINGAKLFFNTLCLSLVAATCDRNHWAPRQE